MSGRKTATLLLPIIAALAIVALTLYAYRSLPARPFAADDYQWLLSVQGLGFGALVRRAFDPTAQTHFYRPLIWLLFWAQTRAFGLDPRGFHAVSLALHLLNAALLGAFLYRLQIADCRLHKAQPQSTIPLLVAAIVALHPAPFEAVVWISAQSELLAAALLLLALHLWLGPRTTNDERRMGQHQRANPLSSSVLRPWSVLATLALGLALLAKESAVIGLPLLMVLGQGTRGRRQGTASEPQGLTFGSQGTASEPQGLTFGSQGVTIESQGTTFEPRGTTFESRGTRSQEPGARDSHSPSPILSYLLPTLVTLAYIALQVIIERRNYLLEQGGYGLGAQLVLNPLRSLALLAAPLPGTEHADAPWLVPLGALVAATLLGFWVLDIRFWKRQPQSKIISPKSKIMLALGLTLLPTAPFASPPDSRYLYLPVMASALLISLGIDERRKTKGENHSTSQALRPSSFGLRPLVLLCSLIVVLALAGWAASELHAREGRFAAASGPGGSLWQVATWACDASRPERVAIVEPPLAAPHVEAIIELACGADVRAKIVGSDQLAGAIKGRTLVLAFPNGSAEVQHWP